MTWKFLDALDAVLGLKHATKPPLILDTLGNHAEQKESNDDAEIEDDHFCLWIIVSEGVELVIFTSFSIHKKEIQ